MIGLLGWWSLALFNSEGLKSFDINVLRILFGKERARFSEIRNHIMKTHEWEKKGSLEVRLSRRLSSLKKAGYVNRDEKGHKLVYYSLTKPTLKRMKLEASNFKEFVEEYYPLLSMDTYTFTNQTPISNLKYYLSVIPPKISINSFYKHISSPKKRYENYAYYIWQSY